MVGLDFEHAVAPGGYRWWYVDALSDDGTARITLIAFIGSVFSPYYARARRRGAADPLEHCAFNVVVHAPGLKRWAMTERGARSVRREPALLCIGPSALRIERDTLLFRIDERCAPWSRPVRGEVRVVPVRFFPTRYTLDPGGLHRWHPLAPLCRIEVDLDAPSMRWSGDAYCDSNDGDEPPARRLHGWHWMRGSVDGEAVVTYDVRARTRADTSLALRFSRDGRVVPFDAPPLSALAHSKWRLPRAARTDDGAHDLQSLDDTPFYARSIVSARLCGAPTLCVHETLDLDRFASPLVQAMLPFRMPRRA